MKTQIQDFTYREFINYVDKTPRSERSKRQGSTSSNKKDTWSGDTGSLKSAIKLAREGWDSGMKQLDIEDGVLVDAGHKFNPHIQGALVNVPAYLEGQPDCMWELSEEREYNLEELDVVVPLCYSAYNSDKKIMSYCQSVVKLLNQKQTKHNVRVIIVTDNKGMENGLKRLVGRIVVKDFDERFVLNNVAFAFHTSFFRRLVFKWWETTDHLDSWGYGTVPSQKETRGWYKENADGKYKTLFCPGLNDMSEDASFTEDNCTKINF